MKITLLLVLVLLVIVLLGRKLGWVGTDKPVEVYVDTLARRTIYESITVNSRIEPVVSVKVSADVSDKIIDFYIKEEQSVKKVQLLLRIKPNVYMSGHERVQASLDNAGHNHDNTQAPHQQALLRLGIVRMNYERSMTLWENKTISQSDWEAAESEYKFAQVDVQLAVENVRAAELGVKSAEASLAEANENFNKTSVYASMDGIIPRFSVKRSERVVGTDMMASTGLLQLADLNKLQVVVSVNENDIVWVKVGDTAVVEVDAFLGKEFAVVVTDIAHSASVSGQLTDQVITFEVKIVLLPNSYGALSTPNSPNPFRPGMAVNVDIHTRVRCNAVLVPLAALTIRPRLAEASESLKGKELTQEVVFEKVGNWASMRPVITGIQEENCIEALKG